ncbi:MAG: hypothetical protein U0Q16_28580 [Bryobacteraceae bacterium]
MSDYQRFPDDLTLEEWQLAEVAAAIRELDESGGIDHERVVEWVSTWGTPGERLL